MVENSVAGNFFGRQLTALSLRVSNLVANKHQTLHNSSSRETLKREINTCSALLEQLHDQAIQHEVQISSDQYKLMIKIKASLEMLNSDIQRQEKSWWSRLEDFSKGI